MGSDKRLDSERCTSGESTSGIEVSAVLIRGTGKISDFNMITSRIKAIMKKVKSTRDND